MSEQTPNVKLSVIQGGKQDEATDYILDVFGQGGYLSRRIQGYRPRQGQIQLARTIDQAIRQGHHVIGEGPTGTGKSLAYAAPAAYHAVHNGLRIGVVTANKNLQRQVYQKDLAELAEATPWNFTYGIRKGISSYLCERNFREGKWREGLFEFPDQAEAIELTRQWAEDTSTGDFEDSPGAPGKVWALFSTNREECDGRKCRDFASCWVNKAKLEAAEADIVVTNYHLFFLALSLAQLPSDAEPNPPRLAKILPDFDVVIMDEAHRAANIARDFFGSEVTWSGLYRCVTNMHMVDEIRGFKTRGKALRDRYMVAISQFFYRLGDLARAHRNVLGKGDCPSEEVEQLLTLVAEFYLDVARKLDPAGTGGKSTDQAMRGAAAGRYRLLAEKSLLRQDELKEFREISRQGLVYFVEGSGYEEKGRKVKLKSRAIEVGGYMRAHLFDNFPTVVQTSATLAVRGGKEGDFDFLKREIGMKGLEDVDEIVVESPFNWPKQALLVIPSTMPEFRNGDASWDQAVCEHLEQIVNVVQGRTLGLFTSFRMLNIASEYLRGHTKWPILVQREATNRELAERFQTDRSSVLLGTESFSEGVSIEGEACTCVVLDKIPFMTKDDPVLQGIERKMRARGSHENIFNAYMLPEAIISFKQRIGRLIRTVSDVGVIVVLDKRLLTKTYRHQFIKSIPPLQVHEQLDAIGPFLRRVGAL